MKSYKIIFPEEFKNHFLEIESKGWFDGIFILFNNKIYKLVVYEKIRLMQDIEEEIKLNFFFKEVNLLVVDTICKKNIEDAIHSIYQLNEIERFSPYHSSRNSEDIII